jgi:pyridoxine 5-phosphate synthase
MRLYINVDHVATVREARRTDEPDPVLAAEACEAAGADGITAHLREDRRHIQDEDVRRLKASVRTVLNVELATADEVVALVEELAPHQATFVPERREEITTEGGLELVRADPASARRLEGAIARLRARRVRISLFIAPDLATIDRARALGVEAIELHTGEYAHARADPASALARLTQAARHARAIGLAVHAGHGLTYRNVQPVAAIPEIEELNIGHSVVSRSVMVGVANAVREMRGLVDRARVDPVPGRP